MDDTTLAQYMLTEEDKQSLVENLTNDIAWTDDVLVEENVSQGDSDENDLF